MLVVDMASAAGSRGVDTKERTVTNRSVSVVHERGEWYVRSEDGDVGGIFISQDAALRYVDRELCRGQGRPFSSPNARRA